MASATGGASGTAAARAAIMTATDIPRAGGAAVAGAGSTGAADDGADGVDGADTLLPERERFCPACLGPVGRGRDGRAGQLWGTCPWCRRAFDLCPHLAAGDVVAGWDREWRVTGLLARGGRAWLHRVVDARGTPGVLTRVRSDEDEAGVVAAGEPELLLALRVPGLVGVLDVADGPGRRRHLVLELVDAAPPDPPLDPAEAAHRVAAAARTIARLHGAGLLHADLKPAHLLAGAEGVTVVDLGGVRRADDRTSPVWGTDGFVAPEVVPGGAGPSPASDVWALGATLAALVGGPVGGGGPAGGTGTGGGAGRRARIAASGLRPVIAAATVEDPGARPDAEALADRLDGRPAGSAAGRRSEQEGWAGRM